MQELTHLSLFTGIGGIDLAAEWAGFRTVAQVEINPFCRRVLAKHWPDVPRLGDIRDVDGATYAGVTLVSGGFPCQPFSHMGQQRGTADHRHLWPEMLRIIRDARPAWVCGENVIGFLGMAFDLVAADLEGEGYAVQAFDIPASGVGAYHHRRRCFVLAHTEGVQLQHQPHTRLDAARHSGTRAVPHQATVLAVGDTEAARRDAWAVEPGICRVADGLPGRMDRLRALGNAVVPQQVYPILRAIAATMEAARTPREAGCTDRRRR